MRLLNLLGFISLISLLILLLIYILKPNYEQHFISSTYIWRLSLKYKKKRLPISKLRNVLLIICQVMLLVSLTAVILKPVIVLKANIENECIIIIDASASMRVEYDESTRFSRAIDLAKDKVNETFDEEGILSIVVATNNPYFLFERIDSTSRYTALEGLDNLDDLDDNSNCTYGAVDLEAAILSCQELLLDNPNITFYVYTDVDVDYVDSSIKVTNVSTPGEYNVAVLNGYSTLIDNYYAFTVELASFGRDENIELQLEIFGANITDGNPQGLSYTYTIDVDLFDDIPQKVMFVNSSVNVTALEIDEDTIFYEIPDVDKVFSYESAEFSVNYEDCFITDNVFDIYGGTKEVIKAVYCSNNSNSFFNGILFVLRNTYLVENYDLQITEVKKGTVPYAGYDLYIYEHSMMPVSQPVDGFVIYCDPEANVSTSGFTVQAYRDLNGNSLPLTEEEAHPLLTNIVADNITVSRYIPLIQMSKAYQVLMSCDSKPVIIFRDDEDIKNLVLLFSLHYSNLPILMEFPLLFMNIFDTYFPTTIYGHSFEVNDVVEVKSRSREIQIEGNGKEIVLDTFPSKLSLDYPGTYTVRQTTYFGKDIVENVYVNVPESESNINYTIDTLTNPIKEVSNEDFYDDLLFYIAIALCSFIFLEWLLKGNEAV